MHPRIRLQAVAANLLAVAAMLVPWTQNLQQARLHATAGWQIIPGWLALAGIATATLATSARARTLGLAACGAAVVAWPVAVEWQTASPDFHRLAFEFHWVDVTDVGWILALLGWLIAGELAARRAAEEAPDPSPAAAAAWCLIPGMGLTRQHLPGRGRVWMAAFAFGLFFLHITAVDPVQIAFDNATGALPLPTTRAPFVAAELLLVMIWAASAVDSAFQWRGWVRPRQARAGLDGPGGEASNDRQATG
jgi:hypothetical protein